MASKIDICNLSLYHLGMKPIASTTDNNPSARACEAFFNLCVEDMYSEYKWPFATAKELMAETTDEVIGWDKVYAYPIRAARVWYIYNEATTDTKEEQEFECIFIPEYNKRVICTNLEEAYAEYTYKILDPSLFDPKFSMALSYRLASSIAVQLTGDDEKAKAMVEVYNGVLHEAKRLSFVEKRKKPTQNSGYQKSRG